MAKIWVMHEEKLIWKQIRHYHSTGSLDPVLTRRIENCRVARNNCIIGND